jgi:hypothetical protein
MPTDAERLRNSYRTSLGRDASDAEIAGWTSGRFGGGGVADWERQIAGSHEAQQRGSYQAPAAAPLSNLASPGGYVAPGTRSATPSSTVTPTSSTTSAYDPFVAFQQANQTGTADQILRRAYKTWTGRDADEAGLKAHMSNPGGLPGAAQAIWNSDEAQKYRAANPYEFQDPATRGPAPGTAPAPGAPGAPAAAPTVTPQIFQGFTPKYAMEGFDFNREQNTGKSAKDAFAYLSNNAPPPPINDKAKLGAWFQQYVAPGMNALGHKIISVNGDSFTFQNWQGTFTVDFGRGAGAEGGALAWQVQEDSAKPSNGAYTPLNAATGATGANATGIDPATGQPVQAYAPISSSITYRRPYQGYDDNQQTPPAI